MDRGEILDPIFLTICGFFVFARRVILSSALLAHQRNVTALTVILQWLEGLPHFVTGLFLLLLPPLSPPRPRMDAREQGVGVVPALGQKSLADVAANQTKQALLDIVFGSTAGIAGKFIEYPFDTVKVRLQSQPHGSALYTGPLDCFRQSWHSQGINGLYRGISAPLVGAAIETSSLFFSYRLAQNAIQSLMYKDTPGPLPMTALISAGAISGAFTSLLLTPIELIKCKMQVPATSSAHTTKPPGPLALMAAVYCQHGLAGFWHGQLGTLIRETGGSAAWFGSFEGVSLAFRGARPDTVPPDAPLPISQQLLAGAAAGMSYNFLFYPADTIKSRMQTEEVGRAARQTFTAVGRELWRDQGIRGLYRGCGITVFRSAPSSAFIFTIYEGLKNAFG